MTIWVSVCIQTACPGTRTSAETMVSDFSLAMCKLETAVEELKFPVDGITLHCDPEVSCNFIALTILSFNMILRQREELETDVPWF